MSLFSWVRHFFFPPACAACKRPLESQYLSFCENCIGALKLVAPDGRCSKCFLPLQEQGHICPCFSDAQAVCFEESRLTHFMLGRMNEQVLASFMVVQFLSLSWPLPDIISPTPRNWMAGCDDGWMKRKNLARQIGNMLNRPVCNIARINSFRLPYRYVCLEKQKAPCPEAMTLTLTEVKDKTVLLIHDIYSFGNAMSSTAQLLTSHGAARIMGLAFAATSSSPIFGP